MLVIGNNLPIPNIRRRGVLEIFEGVSFASHVCGSGYNSDLRLGIGGPHSHKLSGKQRYWDVECGVRWNKRKSVDE